MTKLPLLLLLCAVAMGGLVAGAPCMSALCLIVLLCGTGSCPPAAMLFFAVPACVVVLMSGERSVRGQRPRPAGNQHALPQA